MPLFMFLVGAATLAVFATTTRSKPASRPQSQYQLDANLEPQTRAYVEAALANENDPGRLEAFAAFLSASFPHAAWYLRQKADALRKMGYGGAPAAALPAPRGDGLDANLPDALRFNVLELLTQGNDPAMIESFAAQLGTAYPLATAALRRLATMLRSAEQTAAKVAAQVAAAQSGAPGAVQPNPAAGSLMTGIDANMPAAVVDAVTKAMLTENDPAKLRALAGALLPTYPLAAASVMAKVDILATLSKGATNAPSMTPGAPAPTAPPFTLPDGWTMPGASAPATQSTPPAQSVPVVKMPDGWTMPESSTPPPPPFKLPDGWTMPAPTATAPPPAPTAPNGAPPPAATGTPADLASPLLDATMSPADRAQVNAALNSESDPAKLRALSDAIAPRFPKAAYLLSAKAAAIQAMMIPASLPLPSMPQAQATPSAPPASASPAPRTMSARTYRVKQGDFPIKIAKLYKQPEAGWRELVDANAHKPKAADGNFKQLLPGEDLNIPASWPAGPGDTSAAPLPVALMSAPMTAPAPAPYSTPGPLGLPLPGPPVLDAGIPAQTAQAVMTALATETDAARLRDFASSIMATYPIAAAVLLAKAGGTTLGIPGLPAAIPAIFHPGSAPTPAPVLVSAPQGVPAQGAGKYKVERGDSPSRIAKKITGNDRRWPELVKANPNKATTADGNFKSLQPGEVLTLPAAWSSPPQPTGARA